MRSRADFRGCVGLRLDADDPRQVTATIAVLTTAPVHADTQAGLEFQGLTGVPVISLRGGAPGAARLSASDGRPPVLIADPAAAQSMTEAAKLDLPAAS